MKLLNTLSASSIPALCGPVRQLAFVPRDFERAIDFWTRTMGVGPFFYLEHIPLEDVLYRGSPIKYDCSAAIAYWGELEIELLRQDSADASILSPWLNGEREGIHHIRVQVRNLEEARETFLAKGGIVVQEAKLPGGGEYVMFEMAGFEPYIEVSVLHPRFESLFALMKRSARNWDGKLGLRPVPPEQDWTRS